MILALRSPTFLPDILFETHWPLWLAAIAVGIACFFAARSRNDRRLLLAGQLTILITLLWLAAALLFDTPSERLHAAHKSLAAASKSHDMDAILSYLAPDFMAPNLGIRADALKSARDDIAALLKQYGIKDSTITSYSSRMSDTRAATTDLTVITQTEIPGVPLIKTSWQLLWTDDPASNWKITTATLTKLGDQSVSPTEVIHE